MKTVEEGAAEPSAKNKTAALLKELPPLRKGHLREIPIDEIEPNPEQPRKEFDVVAMAELTESIKQVGLLQPIAVRHLAPHERNGATYQIILGERRWRACRAAGVLNIEAKVYGEVTATEAKILALVENLQRADMNPIEEAAGFKALLDEGYTQEQIAKIVGRSRPVVANALRVLELPPLVIDLIRDKHLTMAHGVAIARFKAWPKVAEELAAYAHEKEITATELEDETLPCANHLVNAGVAVRVKLAWGEKLPAELKKHPAYFGDEYSEKFCLEPEHWKAEQKKMAAAKKAEQEKARQEQEAAADKAKKGKKLKMEDLDRNSYAELKPIQNIKGLIKLVPEDKRAVAKNYHGDDVAICMDKKLVEDLKKHADDIIKEDRIAKVPGLITKAREKIKQIKRVGSRELSMLLCCFFDYDFSDNLSYNGIDKDAAKRQGVKFPDSVFEAGRGEVGTERLTLFNNVDQTAVIRVMLDTILANVQEHMDNFCEQDAQVLRWLLEVDELGLLNETDEGRKAIVEMVKGRIAPEAKAAPAATAKAAKKGGKAA